MESVILSEDFAGLQAQARGLAERAGLEPELRVLRAGAPWSLVPARYWPDPVRVVAPVADVLPDLVIGCGGMAAAVGARLRRGGRRVVHVQHPRMDVGRFDLVVVNRHDGLTGANVIVTRTALHRATTARLDEARRRWAPVFAALPRPLVSVLVGGSNGRYRLDGAVAAGLAAQLMAMMGDEPVGLALTPSRRTGSAAVAVLREALEPMGGWVWNGEGDNPYFGLLAVADAIIVTGDSVSMMSEACATGVPVMVAALPGRSRRIDAFTAGLVAEGRVRRYGGRLETWAAAPLDDTDMAAHEMRTRLGW